MSFSSSRVKNACKRLSGWDWILWFGLGGWLLVQFLLKINFFAGALAVPLLSAGVFQLFAHRWAWHVGLGAWLVGVAAVLLLTLRDGFTFLKALWLLSMLWGVWTHYRERPRYLALTKEASGGGSDEDEGPEHSLVFLLRSPLYLDASILGQIASRAYGVTFNDGDDCECFVVGKENAPYVMRVQDALFLVHHWARPYFDDPGAVADDFRELRRANAVREHGAWFSVDFVRASSALPDDKILDAIGRLLAEVAALDGAEILAVCHPSSRRIEPWEPELREKLASGDPLSVFGNAQVPVIQVASDSPAMIAAVAEARRRWPEFLAAYQAAADKDPFSVKAPVTEGGRTEFIWINVKAIAGDDIHGFLANDPVALGDLKLGSFVTVRVSELNDWVCPDPAKPDHPLGLFTVKAVSEAARR